MCDVDPIVPTPRFSSIDHALVFHSNVGYGHASNEGAVQGDGDVILLANADTVITPGSLWACYEALMSRDDWGVLGPRQVNSANMITAGGIFGPSNCPAQRGWNEADHGQYSDIRDDAVSVSGALYFIKRSVWNTLTYCPVFQHYQPAHLLR